MIDWTRIERLRADLGDADFREVVSMSLEEIEAVVPRLGDGSTAAEREGDLHFLKGCGLNLGMTDFAEACSAAEDRARAGQDTRGEGGRIAALYDESRASLEAGLRDRGVG